MRLPQEIIRRKRDGAELSAGEIAAFVTGLTDGSVSEAQAAALAMAVFFRGMSGPELVALTRAMAESGTTLDWPPDLGGPVVDKHSSGGVGDKVSLVLAPVLAACGAYVPMISGRGLGHTGGTLDKLDSIPGYDTAPDLERLRRVVREVGCAVIGQTPDLAPADRRLYAIRDVTGTVETIPLLTSSILSKKLAAGLQALVMDVKVGSGAFLPALEDARALATAIVEVATGAGLPCRALLTDMDQCLGRTAGNALEVREAVDMLAGGGGEPRLREVTLSLCAEALVLARSAGTVREARDRVERALDSGAAAERFAAMVRALGGPGDLLDAPDRHLPRAPVARPVHPEAAGLVAAVRTRQLGLAVIGLGGGRRHTTDAIDHAVGLSRVAGIGEAVGPGPDDAPLALVHARSEGDALRAAAEVGAAFVLAAAAPPTRPPLIHGRIG
ncbi:MAG TPA: thymidine phosphorylase [Geminicoccaceae bacterium]|nr:thymidine phosphorylase [Geminicoccaceae bacterium]